MKIRHLQLLAFLLLVSGCKTTPDQSQPSSEDIISEMGIQAFDHPGVPVSKNDSSLLESAIGDYVRASESLNFRIDGSEANLGKLSISAQWKGMPITLEYEFFEEDDEVAIRWLYQASVAAVTEQAPWKINHLIRERIVDLNTDDEH